MESVWAVLVLLCCYVVRTEAQIELNLGSTSSHSDIYRLLKQLGERVEKLENKPEVAFSASLVVKDGQNNLGPYDSDKDLVFDEVTVNIGGAYDPQTGNFTAPAGGVYHFIFSCYAGTTKKVNVELLKNGVNIAAISETGNPEFSIYHGGSSGVTVELRKGDKVHVVLRNGSSIYVNSRINMFSGHLLFPITDQ
ncbi:complement C1q tumor necrosis factor-related protein 3 [Esox lucius]|uniref:C1q domain-containing protein n=1 Tax=Esox lucius TaxID=8010 RepID=A0AAY5L0M7_ESOLU|nr:complement C1q tumor necrosis factor-related protein 3 [Esox lucius]